MGKSDKGRLPTEGRQMQEQWRSESRMRGQKLNLEECERKGGKRLKPLAIEQVIKEVQSKVWQVLCTLVFS